MSDKKQIRLTSPIPNDTKEALKLHNWQIDNIALLLNKYLDFLKIFELEDKKNNKRLILHSVLKNTAIKNISFFPVISYEQLPKNKENDFLTRILDKNKDIGNLSSNFKNNLKEGLKQYRKFLLNGIKKGKIYNLLQKIHKRQKEIADSKEDIKLTTQTRLVVGLGSGSVLETSIKLHHIYGVPYIPASAIKGVLRAYRIWKLAEWDGYKFVILEEFIENHKDKGFEKLKSSLIEKLNSGKFDKKLKNIDETLKDDDFKKMKTDLIEYIKNLDKKEEIKKIVETFGNQQQKGKLIILDAYPTNFEGFDIDIMNPHFPDYYDKDEPPADWQNPNPITFLTIPAGTKFKFFFKNVDIYDGNLKEDLQKAFKNIGIGGKTALGYGLFKN